MSILIWSFLAVCIPACRPERSEPTMLAKPELSEAAMIDVLYDIHLAEATHQVQKLKKEEYQTIEEMYCDVFSNHKITRTQYEQALAYYSANPPEMKELYEKIKKQITDQLDIQKASLGETK